MEMKKSPAGVGSLAAYSDLQQVGEGTFGYVYKATHRGTNQTVALKRLIFHKKTSGFPLPAVREVKFLKSLRHKNLVQLLDVISSKGCEHIERFIPTDTNRNFDKEKAAAAAAATTATTTVAVGTAAAGAGPQNGAAEAAAAAAGGGGGAAAAAGEDDDGEDDLDTCRLCGNIYLVFEFVEYDLSGLIDSRYKFQEREIKCIMQQLLEALDYLSERRVLHRDIKTSNILITDRHQLKLADFGLARSIASSDFSSASATATATSTSASAATAAAASAAAAGGGSGVGVDMTNNVITLWYKPPELLLGAVRYGTAVDMWSAGCVMAELQAGRPLFPGRTEAEQFELISRALGTPNSNIWPGIEHLPHYETLLAHPGAPRYLSATLRSTLSGRGMPEASIGLLERMLALDPSRRSSPRMALQAKYFNTPPVAPKDPAELQPLHVTAGDTCHEFKSKRRKRLRELGADVEAREAEQLQQKKLAAAAAAAATVAPLLNAPLAAATATVQRELQQQHHQQQTLPLASAAGAVHAMPALHMPPPPPPPPHLLLLPPMHHQHQYQHTLPMQYPQQQMMLMHPSAYQHWAASAPAPAAAVGAPYGGNGIGIGNTMGGAMPTQQQQPPPQFFNQRFHQKPQQQHQHRRNDGSNGRRSYGSSR